MSGATAEISWRSDGRDAEKTVENLEKKYGQLLKMMERLQGASERGTASAKSGLEGGTAAAVKFAAALGGTAAALEGMRAVAAAIRAEYDSLVQRQQAAAGAQLDAGNSLRNARMAFTGDRTLRADQFDAAIQGVAQKRGSTVPIVAPVAQTVFSAKGSMTNAEALRVIDTAIEISPQDAGQAATIGGRLADTMKAFGTDDPRAAAGFLAKFQQASRVTNMQNVGANLSPAVGALRMFGDTAEQGAEIVATLNQLAQDESGAATRTSAISLGAQLEKFLPKLPSTAARLAALQADPKQAEAFMGKASFEQAMAPFIRSMVTGDPAAMAAMRAAQAGINPLGPQSARDYQQWLAFVNGGKFQPHIDAVNQGGANIEGFRLNEGMAGRTARAREILEKTLGELDLRGPDIAARAAATTDFEYLTRRGLGPERAAQRIVGGIAEGPSNFYNRQLYGELPTGNAARLLSEQTELLKRLAVSNERMEKQGREDGWRRSEPLEVRPLPAQAFDRSGIR